MKKGFTLIELLAVIVILAVIATIATPIVLNIINNSKQSARNRSLDNYVVSITNAMENYQLKNPDDENITYNKIKDYISYEGENITCAITEINSDGTIYLEQCEVGGVLLKTTRGEKPFILPVTANTATYGEDNSNKTIGNIPDGNYNIGDEYIINVDGVSSYHFYVLANNLDTVSFILDRNIWSVTPNIGENVMWNSKSTNSNGPITAMNFLYNKTKNWVNIPNISLNYNDEKGFYGGIYTVNDTTTITSKSGTVTATYIGLKAKLPSLLEMENIGCREGIPISCPIWSINYLNCEFFKKSISYFSPATNFSNSIGYALASSAPTASNGTKMASQVSVFGLSSAFTQYSYIGVRPVIEIPKSLL